MCKIIILMLLQMLLLSFMGDEPSVMCALCNVIKMLDQVIFGILEYNT